MNSTERLEKGKILPLVLRLTMPAVVAQLITFLYNIVDRMYVAKIGGAGMDALAALGIVLPITLIIQAFSNLIGLGGAPRASMKLGEGDGKEANKIFNTAFVLLFATGVVLSLATFFGARGIVVLFGCPDSAVDFAESYLKIYSAGTVFVMFAQGLNPFITAQGYSLIAMLSVFIGALANIALDPLFIFAFGMGVKGASLATVISQCLSFVWILVFFFNKKSIFKPSVKDMKPNGRRILSILALGLSPFIMLLTECAIQIVFNINLKAATGGNKDYTAALTIMLSALQLISLPLNGLGYGMQPFVSYNYGKGNAARLKQGVKCVTLIAFIFAAVMWSLSMAFPQVYAYLFSASASVLKIVKNYSPLFLMGSIMFFVQMTLQNVNVALGRAKSALFLAVLRKVIILIPLCFLLTHFLGFKGVYMSEGIADLAAGIITAAVLIPTFPKVFKERERAVLAKREADAEIYRISNGTLDVKISALGAEIVSVVKDGRERSWQNDNGAWAGHAPVLFPVCGNCAVVVGGKNYGIKKHGFARKSEFTCVRKDDASAEFELAANERTKEVYPFDFVLRAGYRLESNRIVITQSVANIGDSPLYFGLGGHDSFSLDKDVGEYKLVFEKPEKFDSLAHDGDGILTGEVESFGDGNELTVPEEYLNGDRTVILAGLASRKVTLCEKGGKELAEVGFDGYGNLLLWRPHGARMICIEPWQNLPDGKATAQVELADKRGMQKVEPNARVEFVRYIEYY